MKKALIFILLFCLVFGPLLPNLAYGQGVEEKLLEEVILKVKEKLRISNDYDDFVSRVSSYDGDTSFNLSWSHSDGKLPTMVNDNSEGIRDLRLIYLIDKEKPSIIDAFTGQILDNSGKPYRETTIPLYNDIDNSYAKEKILVLTEYGVGFSGDRFYPKEKIKQEDFLFLLWKAMNPYRAYGKKIWMTYMVSLRSRRS